MAKKDEKKEKDPKGTAKTPDKEVIAELTDSLQRLQAEFENFKKRVDKEQQEFSKFAKAGMIQKILPIFDNFEIAMKNTGNHEAFVKGVDLIFSEMKTMLDKEGVIAIESLGKKLDPFKHDVMLKAHSDQEEGIIIEELQKGYMLHDKVLRHAKVKVSEGQAKEKQEKEEAKKEVPTGKKDQ